MSAKSGQVQTALVHRGVTMTKAKLVALDALKKLHIQLRELDVRETELRYMAAGDACWRIGATAFVWCVMLSYTAK